MKFMLTGFQYFHWIKTVQVYFYIKFLQLLYE
jgi:hypothetical protein